jgi:hypothetical protein
MLSTFSYRLAHFFARKYPLPKPTLALDDQPSWWRAIAPGIACVEGHITVMGDKRIKVGNIEYIGEPEMIDWMKKAEISYAAVYSLGQQSPRYALSVEPFEAPSNPELTQSRLPEGETFVWRDEHDAAVSKMLNIQVTIEPFEIASEVNTIAAFRNNMEGALSQEQSKILAEQETFVEQGTGSGNVNTRKRRYAQNSRQLRDDIKYVEGETRFGYRYGGGKKFPVVTIDDEHFRVNQAPWDDLEAIGGRMGIHYLKPMSVPILLSIQPLPLHDLPTEEDLERVVGIGSDGEFVYEEDVVKDADDQPKKAINLD